MFAIIPATLNFTSLPNNQINPPATFLFCQKKPYEKSELHPIPEISQPLSSNLSLF
jgi:hypothetical protein